ncbi:MAG: geranylgeranylglycerol-phosphate geranylgeranyltransferase [candidate division Zixibacteria bacterium]|nr:geranylgeranylglycerol-phosphate geranylgeranyltransferase [candidate division Zixibacteria bacterium]
MILLSIVRIIRLGNCLIASAAVWVGAYLTVGFAMSAELLTAMCGALLICAGGNTVNDILDIESDRINHPDRPLPSGALSVRRAKTIAVVCHIAAVPLIAISNWQVMSLGILTIAALMAYNVWLKGVPLVGNMLIGLLGAAAFMCGGLAADPDRALSLPGPLIAATFALMLHLIREMVKDIEDIDGDRWGKARSLPRIIGGRSALLIAMLLFGILALLTVLPYASGWFGPAYAATVVLFVDVPILAMFMIAWGKPSRRSLGWLRSGLKMGMLFGLIALLVG